MKNMIKNLTAVIVLTLMVGISNNVNAQTPSDGGKQYVEIKTSAVCGSCKKTIETALNDVKGVEKATLDVDSKIVAVNYNPEKVSVDEIKKAINHAGYDADDMPAEKDAYDNLHGCCKKDAVH